MPKTLDPFRFVLIALSGWMNQHQLQIIDYLREENRVLREQLGGRRVRFNDDQRCRLAAKAKGLGLLILAEVATIVTPETLLAVRSAFLPPLYIKEGNGIYAALAAVVDRLSARLTLGLSSCDRARYTPTADRACSDKRKATRWELFPVYGQIGQLNPSCIGLS